jgi:glycine/D-amino acid oxidase-like deaminating enzyme
MQKGIWIDDNTNIKVYPYLNKDIETNVVVVGGGISGAITAFFLAKEGFDVVVLEKNIIGCSNTSLSCGTITDFTDQMYIKVEKDKETINKMQRKANKLLDEILVDINNNKDLKRINHNIITTKMFQKGMFKAEQEKRNTLGQKVELLEKGNGIVIEEESRLIDTYELTAQIINYLNKFPNVHIYENTSLISFNTNYNGVEITTNNDFKIKAGSLILTTSVDGLNIASIPNSQLYRRFGIKLKTNFKEELSLKVLNDIPIYIRVDNFGNMIVSGIDTKYSYRMENSKVIEMLEKENEKRLIGLVAKIFPKIEIAEEIISFSGNIIDTKDKLPIISEIDKLPNVYLNIGVGCSAIANVLVGADILKEAVQGYYKKEASLFKLNR